MRTNIAPKHPPILTHEGASAVRISAEKTLRRTVLACLMWEDGFYESGVSIADRIKALSIQVDPQVLAALAIEAREHQHLRHVPLFLTSCLVGLAKGALVEDTVCRVVQRADEMAELLAIHAKRQNIGPDKVKKTVSAAMKRGLARAFLKFDEYSLAKYDRAGAVKLRDVLRLVHPKPDTPERSALWARLAKNELVTPDTWEVALSGGADKKETFERLIREGNLGYLALLRNLRGMVDAGCDLDLVRGAIVARKGAHRVLPFRYVAAARACPQLEPAIDTALCASIAALPPLPGRTIVLVDVSGSMNWQLSGKSDMERIDAAAALASIVNGDVRVMTFSDKVVEVPPRRGMAGVDAVIKSQISGGTNLGFAVSSVNAIDHDRLIVITDEQSADRVPPPTAKNAYMINVASNRNGVGYGDGWTHIDGWSDGVLRYIAEIESVDA